jgi:hypothetical protein
MATPNYKGQGQPAATSSGWLSGVFGGTTPAYKTPAPPAATPSAATPSTSGSATTGCDFDQPRQIAIVIPRQVIETD